MLTATRNGGTPSQLAKHRHCKLFCDFLCCGVGPSSDYVSFAILWIKITSLGLMQVLKIDLWSLSSTITHKILENDWTKIMDQTRYPKLRHGIPYFLFSLSNLNLMINARRFLQDITILIGNSPSLSCSHRGRPIAGTLV